MLIKLHFFLSIQTTNHHQKLFLSYILVGDSTIITPISFANET